MQTGMSRFILPLPVLFFPALANIALLKVGLWPRNSTMAKLTELSLCVLSLCVALPSSVALYKQQSMLTREQIDPELRETPVQEAPVKRTVVSEIKDLGQKASTEKPAEGAGKSTDEKASPDESAEKKVVYVNEFYFNKGL